MTDTVRTCITFKDSAEEAVKFYVSLVPNSKITSITRVDHEGGPIPKGKLLNATFTLDGREYMAFDGGETFTFTEGTSMFVNCKTQAEVDKYWSALSANGGEEGPCGWLKDRWGLSWQIIPEQLGQMLSDPEHGNAEAAMNAMLQMRKLEIATLERAYKGAPVA